MEENFLPLNSLLNLSEKKNERRGEIRKKEEEREGRIKNGIRIDSLLSSTLTFLEFEGRGRGKGKGRRGNREGERGKGKGGKEEEKRTIEPEKGKRRRKESHSSVSPLLPSPVSLSLLRSNIKIIISTFSRGLADLFSLHKLRKKTG